MKRSFICLTALFWVVLLVSCGPSLEEGQETVAAQVAQAVPGTIAALPTMTELPSLTPLPTLTPGPTYTPQATLTPLATATAQATYTQQPTLTPLPTATATATPSVTPTRPPAAAAPPPAAANVAETLLAEVNRRIFYYESYNGVFYARCDQFGCDFSLACDQVVYYFDLLTAPYTLNVEQAEPAVQVAYDKLQLAITQAATGYGWANTCRTALANGEGITTQNSAQGNPTLPGDVITLLREAQTILGS